NGPSWSPLMCIGLLVRSDWAMTMIPTSRATAQIPPSHATHAGRRVSSQSSSRWRARLGLTTCGDLDAIVGLPQPIQGLLEVRWVRAIDLHHSARGVFEA